MNVSAELSVVERRTMQLIGEMTEMHTRYGALLQAYTKAVEDGVVTEAESRQLALESSALSTAAEMLSYRLEGRR